MFDNQALGWGKISSSKFCLMNPSDSQLLKVWKVWKIYFWRLLAQFLSWFHFDETITSYTAPENVKRKNMKFRDMICCNQNTISRTHLRAILGLENVFAMLKPSVMSSTRFSRNLETISCFEASLMFHGLAPKRWKIRACCQVAVWLSNQMSPFSPAMSLKGRKVVFSLM